MFYKSLFRLSNILPFLYYFSVKVIYNSLIGQQIGGEPSCVISTAMTHGHESQFYATGGRKDEHICELNMFIYWRNDDLYIFFSLMDW